MTCAGRSSWIAGAVNAADESSGVNGIKHDTVRRDSLTDEIRGRTIGEALVVMEDEEVRSIECGDASFLTGIRARRRELRSEWLARRRNDECAEDVDATPPNDAHVAPSHRAVFRNPPDGMEPPAYSAVPPPASNPAKARRVLLALVPSDDHAMSFHLATFLVGNVAGVTEAVAIEIRTRHVEATAERRA